MGLRGFVCHKPCWGIVSTCWRHLHFVQPAPYTRHCLRRVLRGSKQLCSVAHGAQTLVSDTEPAASSLPTTVSGQVMSEQANFVRVRVDSDQGSGTSTGELLCVVRGILKKMQRRVLVGDHVRVVNVDWQAGRGMVDDVLDRTSELTDPRVANVDHVLLVFALARPPFEPAQVTRFLVAIEAVKLPITLVLNKADLLTDEELQQQVDRVNSWGYKALPASVETGLGLDILEQTLVGKTAVVAGPSGVGKSTIINALRTKAVNPTPDCDSSALNEAATQQEDDAIYGTQAIGEVSDRRYGRGKHTTRNVKLLQLPGGGLVADTPGFNVPALDRTTAADVQHCFPEIRQRLEDAACAFSNCTHLHEPGCVVREPHWERWEYYATLFQEIRERESYELKKLQLSKKRREGNVKVKSKAGGQAQREVRLDPKKFRRSSRNVMKQQLMDEFSDDDDV